MSDENEFTEDSAGIKNLRKEFEALQKKLAERDEKLAKYEAQDRHNSVVNTLKAKGLSEEKALKTAKFYSGDDASEESVGKWLEENADVFGVQTQNPNPAVLPTDPNAANAQRVSEAAFGINAPIATTPSGQPVGDPAEIQRLYQGAASIEQLQAMGLLPKNLNPVQSAMDDWN